MKLNFASLNHNGILPYNGGNMEFLAKNMNTTINGLLIALSITKITADELIPILINHRLKIRRQRINKFKK